MVWMTQVQPGYLKPGTGACLSVLTLASRYGDVQLATDVFRILTERETTFTTHHYELLINTYLKANDLSAALSAILIMADANIKVDEGTCHPLYTHLSTENMGEDSRPMQAFTVLQDFEAAGRKVPTAAINACMQASIALNRLEEAIEIYKALHTVSHAGPNTNTFNILFRGCHRSVRKELAMFFANEMIQLGLKPDRITYDRLILVCLQAGDLEDALLYYEEMVATETSSDKATMKPRRMTWELLIHKCVLQGDERAVAILKAYKTGVEEPRKKVEKAVVDRFEYGIAPVQFGGQSPAGMNIEAPSPTAESDHSQEPGPDTELSDAASGGDPLQTPSVRTEMEKADNHDGLAQVMEASKNSRPY
jgi:pentatricopeptide repeat protein